MAAKIYPKTINGKEYYYLQYSYRKKINSNDSGKTKGSGKSKIKTNSVFLGTAESIKNKLLSSREPLEVNGVISDLSAPFTICLLKQVW